jgi:hypothetical protein
MPRPQREGNGIMDTSQQEQQGQARDEKPVISHVKAMKRKRKREARTRKLLGNFAGVC